MKTVYFNVLSRLSTELSTQKKTNFVLLAKKIFWKKIDFQILLFTFKRNHRRYENRLFLTFYPVSVPHYLQKTPKNRFAS